MNFTFRSEFLNPQEGCNWYLQHDGEDIIPYFAFYYDWQNNVYRLYKDGVVFYKYTRFLDEAKYDIIHCYMNGLNA